MAKEILSSELDKVEDARLCSSKLKESLQKQESLPFSATSEDSGWLTNSEPPAAFLTLAIPLVLAAPEDTADRIRPADVLLEVCEVGYFVLSDKLQECEGVNLWLFLISSTLSRDL